MDAPSVDGLRRGSHSEREILLEDQRAATLREKRDGIRIMKFWMNQTRYTCLTVFLRKSSLSRGIRMKKNRLWKDFVTRKRKRWKLFRFINSEGKERGKCGEVNVVRGELDYRVSSFALLLFDDVVYQ